MLRQPSIGDILVERFEIQARFEPFGMIDWFGAFDRQSQTNVWLLGLADPDEELQSHFADEGRVLRGVGHPLGLAPIEILEVSERGPWSLLLVYPEFPHALSLRHLRGSLSSEEIAWIFGSLPDLLASLHRAPSRPKARLDPSVIFVDRITASLRWFLVPDLSHATNTRTTAGTIKMELRYLSPEEVIGRRKDLASSYFSLGSMLFEAASGTALFQRDSGIASLEAIRKADTSGMDGSTLDPALKALVKRLVTADPKDRLQTPHAIQDHLRVLAPDISFPPDFQAPPPEPWESAPPLHAQTPLSSASSPQVGLPPPDGAGLALKLASSASKRSSLPALEPPGLPSSFTEADRKEEGASPTKEVKILRRKASVRYYKQMNPERLFPLLVSLMRAEIALKVPELARVGQAESEQVMEIQETSPLVRIVPLLPGCLVSPPEVTIDIRPDHVDTTFWVTPLVIGDLQGAARIQIWHEGQMKEEIPLPIRLRKQTLTQVMSAGMLLSSVGGGLIEAYGKATAKVGQAPAFEEGRLLASAVKAAIHLLGHSGLAIAAAFLAASLFCYLWLRPKRGEEIERFLNTEIYGGSNLGGLGPPDPHKGRTTP